MMSKPEETKGYRQLIVWQKAMELVPRVYELMRFLPRDERYLLGDQMRRAVVSVPANIAEGQARHHQREFRHHLSIARGSLAEVDTLLLAAQSLGHLSSEALAPIQEKIIEIRRLLQGLMRRLA